MSEPLLDITGLRAAFPGPRGPVEAVRGVGFTLEEGEVLGIVGESGSGKSVAMMALLQLLPEQATVSGSARFKGRELIGMSRRDIRRIRGRDIGCVFQDPLSAFNPVLTIGAQIVEAIRLHDRRIGRGAARSRAIGLLEQVAIPEPERRAQQYPHEFSGGMRQRAMIAMALANDPALLIADEPTTALDVTVQAQILALLDDLRRERGLAIVFITHDFGVVAQLCDRVAVMYAGRIVEEGPTREVLDRPAHPYTRRLIACVPELGQGRRQLEAIPGLPPVVDALPPGCAFAPRCDKARDTCNTGEIALEGRGDRAVRCLYPEAPL